MYSLPGLPVSLPTVPISASTDLETLVPVVSELLNKLSPQAFVKDAVWRDHFAFTGTIRTFYGSHTISEVWSELQEKVKPDAFAFPAMPCLLGLKAHAWVDVPFTFETNGSPALVASGSAAIVLDAQGNWKIWVLKTVIEGIQGQPSVDGLKPQSSTNGVNGHALTNGQILNHSDPGDGQTKGSSELTNGHSSHGKEEGDAHSKRHTDFDCVVLGGGQAGLAMGGRLKAIGVSYVVLEKFREVGDSWKTRYDSTKLHTPREFGHLPFDRTFPDTYGEFLTKDELARGYKQWVKKYGVNVWLSTTLITGSWDDIQQLWTLKILRHGKESTITASFFVFAGGAGSQKPVQPTYGNRDKFRGIVLHSGTYKNSHSWAGKHGVIVGTANTGHDVAEDMVAAGLASVTMIQRSPTFVVPVEHYCPTVAPFYNSSIPTDVADRAYLTGPYAVSRLLSRITLGERHHQEQERFHALEKVGFKIDHDGDMMKYLLNRFGGHYMDVGASAKIVKGLIKCKSDSLPVAYSETGLDFENGDHLDADVVVLATGFVCNMKMIIAELLGSEVAARLDDFWGLDEEGELKGAFKPSGHPALWLTGGAVGQARFMSRFIALQVKAKLMGTALPVYSRTPFPKKYDVSIQQEEL